MAEDRPGDSELVYLTIEDVLTMHGLIIGASSTEATNQLRNRDGLESVLARPAAYAHYENADLAHQAAALAHGIAEGQQFIDGNKRTALVAMLTFLEVNGLRVRTSDRERGLDTQLQHGRNARAGRGTHTSDDLPHRLALWRTAMVVRRTACASTLP